MIVCKFGGSSMATASSIQRVASVLNSDSRRLVCVVSAPGRTDTEPKMTDQLQSGESRAAFHRFLNIIKGLSLGTQAELYLQSQFEFRANSSHLATRLSFGEHMSAYVLAQLLGWNFVDAASVIHFDNGEVRVRVPREIPVVIPGFYGFDTRTHKITTFPRGGSDITGAHIAASYGARVYENWTDVSGVYDADPNNTRGARPLALLTYDDLSSISRAGAQVFHPDAIDPVTKASIPIHIKNTFAPEDPGTIVQQPSR